VAAQQDSTYQVTLVKHALLTVLLAKLERVCVLRVLQLLLWQPERVLATKPFKL